MSADRLEFYLNQLQTDNSDVLIETLIAATEAPGLFVFGEFLDHPCVRNLSHGPHAAFADLLNLFCYGSFETYLAEPTKYPQLSSAQIRKLKQLSIIDEAHSRKLIPYESLFKKLGVESSRELEDLIIELFYLDALTGKLDQQRALLEVDSAIGRDVRIEQIPELNATMNTWLDRVESILTHIANEVKLANDRRFEMQLHRKRVQEAAASVKEALRGQLSKTEPDTPLMDIDDHMVHPDLLPDGRGIPTRPSLDCSAGDKDGRNRLGVFKGLRKGAKQ